MFTQSCPYPIFLVHRCLAHVLRVALHLRRKWGGSAPAMLSHTYSSCVMPLALVLLALGLSCCQRAGSQLTAMQTANATKSTELVKVTQSPKGGQFTFENNTGNDIAIEITEQAMGGPHSYAYHLEKVRPLYWGSCSLRRCLAIFCSLSVCTDIAATTQFCCNCCPACCTTMAFNYAVGIGLGIACCYPLNYCCMYTEASVRQSCEYCWGEDICSK